MFPRKFRDRSSGSDVPPDYVKTLDFEDYPSERMVYDENKDDDDPTAKRGAEIIIEDLEPGDQPRPKLYRLERVFEPQYYDTTRNASLQEPEWMLRRYSGRLRAKFRRAYARYQVQEPSWMRRSRVSRRSGRSIGTRRVKRRRY